MIYIPNEYTACEAYRGRVIATRHGSYQVFKTDGYQMARNFSSRAAARRAIDADETNAATASTVHKVAGE